MTNRPNHILPLIVLSQFAGTSLWFVGNAVLPELRQSLHLSQYAVSHVTSAVMLGFIAGTLSFAFLSLADRYSPVKLFFLSSLLGALCNSSVAWFAKDASSLFALRFLTGFFLAGIYPVGMKIAADWYEKGLGKALGFLLGALVLGTAFPHLLKNRDFELPWKSVLYCTSLFALCGGLLMLFFVGDGPYRKRSGGFQWNAIPQIFSSKKWRQAAFGYFGHMWELYTFWGFVPLIIELYSKQHNLSINIPLLSFLVISCGLLTCIAGGYLSQKWGSAKVASLALFISGLCCWISPLLFQLPVFVFIGLLFIWGLTVCPDSPQFSTLVAQHAPEHLRGTALTIYNSIGFSISVLSLIVIDHVFHSTGFFGGRNSFLWLGFGAIAGLPSMINLIKGK
ncbi:MAG: MFS transporter [Bacteroidetes bacterium]|jgi:MFS family permease|nr:MAG: MFS transporter [Bacteroidota bacterium]